MHLSRRFLPPTHLLNAFEAAARSGSFSTAARSLNLTQSAVSRQIKALEEFLGVELFTREKQKVHLTEAGKTYADQIREALKIIASASVNIQTNPSGGTLNLAILPTFGTRWLAPRLPDFLATMPGITLNLSTRMEAFDFDTEGLDAAIHFGSPDWLNTERAFLMNETVLPACSAAYKRNHKIEDPKDLQDCTLLHLESRPDAWGKWSATQNVSFEDKKAVVFDQFATAANAARSGLGIALLPTFLIEAELSEETLVPALDLPMESEEAYYLVWPKGRSNFPPLLAFRNWLSQEFKN
ncbi:MAG: LysR family transcriptional regulator [Sneathiella sp.]